MSVTLTGFTAASPANTVTLTGFTAQQGANTVTLTGFTAMSPPNSVTLTGFLVQPKSIDTVQLMRKGTATPVQLQRKGATNVTLHRVPSVPRPLGVSGSWSLLWQDEFDAPLDTGIWMKLRGLGGGYGDPYSSSLDDSAFSASYTTVENGNLRIRWDNTPITVSGNTYPYTTGVAHTGKGFNYLYGYLEARIWVPNNSGLWPAFWMLPLPVDSHWPPEIDISEWLYNSTTNTVEPHFNVHWMDGNNQPQQKGWNVYGSADAGGAWHTYGLLWEPGHMKVVYDGISGGDFYSSNVPSEAHYIIFSGGVRKGFTPPAGNMLVDYVRVWKAQ